MQQIWKMLTLGLSKFPQIYKKTQGGSKKNWVKVQSKCNETAKMLKSDF